MSETLDTLGATSAPPHCPRTGLIEGFAVDARGVATPLSRQELIDGDGVTPPEGGYLWLHFALECARSWLPGHLDLDEATLRLLLAEETRPSCVQHEDGLLMNLRGVNLNEGRSPEDMLSIRIHLAPGRLITVRKQRSRAIEDIRHELRKGAAPRDAGSLLLRLIGGLTDRLEPVVDALSDRVDALEELSLRADTEDLRGELSAMRHDAIVFRRYVAPQREAVTRFSMNEAGLLSKKTLQSVRDEAERVTRVVEELDITRERAGVIYEQIAARRADEMNRNMMIISVVSAVFLPLSFVTGLLGINVGGMPGAQSDAAFWLVCLLCAALGVALLLVFRRMGWL
ncbi:zinc transporter ZntB [Parvularcula dongshanensis]|uniref:Zinc transporter n=1 Tax=Parvularcula dongshanensis TaxID=1173995 RepID=A0A840I3K5_9PROT|nr:zinc transporter ZntB [Parvularcula dongshanensis]MBB4658853.1 zinc transporter [Parvularcula dongshanensis]